MKQNISIQDLDQLSNKGKDRLREWWSDGRQNIGDWYYDGLYIRVVLDDEGRIHENIPFLPLLSLGQMIQFLDEKWKWIFIKKYKHEDGKGYKYNYWSVTNTTHELRKGPSKELCDSLWQAVREILEKDE